MTRLSGPWRFHPGDNPAWSSPSLDDSQWSLLYAGRSWSQQGYPSYSGVGWYRLRLSLPASPGPLALYLDGVDESCQVFANGQLIGEIGKLPPHPAFYLQFHNLFLIPPSAAIESSREVQLAVRVWIDPRYAGDSAGGLTFTPLIGSADLIDQWKQLQIHNTFWQRAARIADVFINLFTAFAGIGLFLLRRREREYLWWGVSQAFWAAFAGISLAAAFFRMHLTTAQIASVLVQILAYYLQYVFYVLFLRQRQGRLFWTAVLSVVAAGLLSLANVFGVLQEMPLGTLGSALGVLSQACIVGILAVGARGRQRDAAILLIPNCVMLSCDVLQTIAGLPQLYSQPQAAWIRSFLSQVITWPFNLGAFQLVGDLEMLAVLVILVRRYARSRQEEERLESELEAARAVQTVLIPTDVPSIPGFAIETVYRPASQVGGDFFQIIPIPTGGALIAIGDVSGKGMPAAMTVSLLVGTLRTLAWYTQSPSEVLSAMNRRMLSRSHGGFTTCLVLRLNPDGSLIMANAGHIPPYIDGREVELDNALPLGLDSAADYPETTIHLDSNAQLTLLTDGVVEARNATGELLGFERTRQLSTKTAQQVAHAAQSFGQEDDITVLTLSTAPAPVAV
jgi:sigma-B regulation protein RsbU (phosphoserine phosphatase)